MIQISHLDFNYKGNARPIFQDFSLTLGENKVYGLLGKNGTGKSTLLYLLSGLLFATKGEVRVDGYDAKRRLPQMLEDIFVVPEEYNLPNVSLDQYVKINRSFYPRFSEDILHRCLQEFELPTNLKLSQLSMGQKKKVYMSFALAAGTKYLFMDEPTNGLDIPAKAQFRQVIANNMEEHRTVIISTHQVKDVEALLDHVVMLEGTNLLLDLSMEDIMKRYTFEMRQPSEMDDTVLYAEPSLMGNAVMARNMSGKETPVNLELLFTAATLGRL